MKVDGLLKYMVEREKIRLAKDAGKPRPWTDDPILQRGKFTNVRRLHDRTTQGFLKIYKQHESAPAEVFLLHCGIFRYFGTIAFAQAWGWEAKPSKRTFERICKLAADLTKKGVQIFTGAYIVTSGGVSGPKEQIVSKYLEGLWFAADLIVKHFVERRTWRGMFDDMSKLPGFKGTGFMTKEVLQDFLLMHDAKDKDTWTPVGPGGRRGINRVMGRVVDYRQPERLWPEDSIAIYKAIKPLWHKAMPKDKFGLTAHDVQFCMCEFDKYERIRLGEGRPRTIYVPYEEK